MGTINADGTVTLSRDELARAVQSEADRKLAKLQQDEQTRAEKEELRQLRRDDPLEYARRIDEQEQQQTTVQKRTEEAVQLLDQQLFQYDRHILDPLVSSLPDKLRAQVLEASQAEGIPGRAELAKNALKALRQLWQAEGRETARERLMQDEVFIKEVLARYGGVPKGEPEAPVSSSRASAGAPASEHEAVNDWIRNAGQTARTTSGRRG